jgi:gluconate 2-dehydrogenase gamma chain
MDGQDKSAADSPGAAKRFGRRATLKLLGLTLSGAAATGAGASTALPDAQAVPRGGSTRPPGSPSSRGRAWRYRPLAEGITPRVFSAKEFATLGCLVDLIIPDTDTPGAKTAGVHWYLDDVARTEAALREQLRAGCRRLDEHARGAHGHSFVELTPAQQVAILTAFDASGTASVEIDNAGQPQVSSASSAPRAVTPDDRSFFALIKARTLDGYYKSEMGQLGELEWVGHEFHDEFPGRCTHPDPLVHSRPRWPRVRT